MSNILQKEFLPSFVGGRNRGLGKAKLEAFYASTLPKYAFDANSFNSQAFNVVEIGTGYGDTILHLAANYYATNPDVRLVGCEIYAKGLISLATGIEALNISNKLSIFNGDGRALLQSLPNHSLNMILILFPDPWPKARHNKRRIFNHQTLQLCHAKLKPGGSLWFVTDDYNYKTHACQILLSPQTQELFSWNATTQKDFNTPPSWWTQTKFQQKATLNHRPTAYIHLTTTYN